MEKQQIFTNTKGDKLSGILEDAGRNEKAPIVILMHGFSSNKNNSTHTCLVPLLAEQGIASFRFDFYGHGESEGKFEDITLSEAIDDAEQAIAFVKSKGYKRIALMGASFGGMTALLVGAKHPELFALVLKCPVSDYLGKLIAQMEKYPIAEWKKKGYIYYHRHTEEKLRLNYSFFEDAQQHSGYATASNIRVPTLIVHGDVDTSVPIEQSKKTASLISNCKLEIIRGADHRFSDAGHFEKMIAVIADFIENCRVEYPGL